MSTVDVQDIDTLLRFRGALADLVAATQPVLETVPRQVRQLGERFQDAHAMWSRRLREMQALEVQLKHQLHFCMQSGDRDHPPDCRSLEDDVRMVRLEVVRAETALTEIRKMHDLINQAVENYGRAARPLTHLLNEQLPVETAKLEQAAEHLKRYIGVSVLPVNSLASNVWSAPVQPMDDAVKLHQPHAGGHPEAPRGRLEGEPAREAPEMGRRGPLLPNDDAEREPWGELPPMSRR